MSRAPRFSDSASINLILAEIDTSKEFLATISADYQLSRGFSGWIFSPVEAMKKLKLFNENPSFNSASLWRLLQLSFIVVDGLNERDPAVKEKFELIVRRFGSYWPIFKSICMYGISPSLVTAFSLHYPEVEITQIRQKAENIIAHLCGVFKEARIQVSGRDLDDFMSYAHHFFGPNACSLVHAALIFSLKAKFFSRIELDVLFHKLARSAHKLNIIEALIRFKEHDSVRQECLFSSENLELIFRHSAKAEKISRVLCQLSLRGLSRYRALFVANIEHVDAIDYFMSLFIRLPIIEAQLNLLFRHSALLNRLINNLAGGYQNDKLNKIFSRNASLPTELEGIDELSLLGHLLNLCEEAHDYNERLQLAFNSYFDNIVFGAARSDSFSQSLNALTCNHALQAGLALLAAPVQLPPVVRESWSSHVLNRVRRRFTDIAAISSPAEGPGITPPPTISIPLSRAFTPVECAVVGAEVAEAPVIGAVFRVAGATFFSAVRRPMQLSSGSLTVSTAPPAVLTSSSVAFGSSGNSSKTNQERFMLIKSDLSRVREYFSNPAIRLRFSAESDEALVRIQQVEDKLKKFKDNEIYQCPISMDLLNKGRVLPGGQTIDEERLLRHLAGRFKERNIISGESWDITSANYHTKAPLNRALNIRIDEKLCVFEEKLRGFKDCIPLIEKILAEGGSGSSSAFRSCGASF